MNILKRTEFGNPVLREVARKVIAEELASRKIQQLIKDMRHTLLEKKIGIGLAAPQVGKSVALAVIAIRPTKHRPEVEPFDLVIINPEITERIGRKLSVWEGCLSGGSGKAGLFAKVPRHKEIKVRYLDETGKSQHKKFDGLKAQVIQHEVDHLRGVLFVDLVKDTKTYMTYTEYRKLIAAKKKNELQD